MSCPPDVTNTTANMTVCSYLIMITYNQNEVNNFCQEGHTSLSNQDSILDQDVSADERQNNWFSIKFARIAWNVFMYER